MSKKSTKLRFRFSNFQKLEKLVRLKSGAKFEIKPIYYADMIELKDEAFKHTIYFNKSKSSKVTTEWKRKNPIEIALGVLIIGIYILFIDPNLDKVWNFPIALFLVLVLFMLPHFIDMMMPLRKVEIAEAHNQFVEKILSFKNKDVV